MGSFGDLTIILIRNIMLDILLIGFWVHLATEFNLFVN